MKYRIKNSTVKGFTLLEMMIVLGIIAVLTAVVVPISRGYYVSSRQKTENANAKVVFNSLQTICQEYEFAERGEDGSIFYGDTKTGTIALLVEDGQLKHVYLNDTLDDVGNTENRTLTNAKLSEGAAATKATVTLMEALDFPVDSSRFLQRVNRIYSSAEVTSYFAYIENYSVKAVFAADHSSGSESYYIGAYPIRIDEPRDYYLSEIDFTGSYDDDSTGNFKYKNILEYVHDAWD